MSWFAVVSCSLCFSVVFCASVRMDMSSDFNSSFPNSVLFYVTEPFFRALRKELRV